MAKLTKPPERIYLQFYGDNDPKDCTDDSVDTEDITWSEDQVYFHDTEYVQVKKKRKKKKK